MPYDIAVLIQIVPIICSALTLILLTVLCMYVAYKNPTIIRKKSYNLLIGLIFFFDSILLNSQTIMRSFDQVPNFILEIPTLIVPSFSILGCLLLYNRYREREFPSIEGDIGESTITLVEKLGLDLTKPTSLSEEEVKFYKEKTVCLVCKTDLTGFSQTFICPECKALYCKNMLILYQISKMSVGLVIILLINQSQ